MIRPNLQMIIEPEFIIAIISYILTIYSPAAACTKKTEGIMQVNTQPCHYVSYQMIYRTQQHKIIILR